MTEGPYKLPEGWRWVRLGEVFDLQQGASMSPKRRLGRNPKPFLRTKNVLWGAIDLSTTDHMDFSQEEVEKLRLLPGDLLVCEGGDVGRTAIWEGQLPVALYQNHIHRLRAKGTSIEPRFIMHWMKAAYQVFSAYQGTESRTAIPNLSGSRLKQFMAPLPPLEEQRRIVARIEELMARIREARRLRQEAQADADRLMQAALAEVFPRPGSDLPSRWRWVRLGEVCEINPPRPRLHINPNEPTTFVPMTAVDDVSGTIVSPELRPFEHVRQGYTYFQEGDVLFAKITPSMENGKSAIARGLLNGFGFGSTEFHVLRPSGAVIPEWVWLFIRQERFRKTAKASFRGGVGQQRVPQEFLERHPIPLPPLEEQRRIVAYLEAVQEKVKAIKAAQARTDEDLRRLEGAILERAFRGEL